MKLDEEIKDFSALGSNEILLKTGERNTLVSLDMNLRQLQNGLLSLGPNTGTNSKFAWDFNDNTLCVFNYKKHLITSYNVRTKALMDRMVPGVFTRATVISDSSVVIRCLDSNTRYQVFKKLNLKNGDILMEKDISPKVNDAGMATDGQLHYDKSTNTIVFTYYYGNGFLCIDSNMFLKYKGRTIDTTKTFHAHISHGKVYTHIDPPDYINLNSCAENGILYIQSALQSDDESNDSFNENSVIDMYRIKDGQYIGSFLIPNLKT
ncbi:MAG TPA: hypothetical protein VHA56_12080 [Mucilaginibacter sp.]|nr:hypothetical protein [Mucilaginibacter sp.]